MTGRPTDDASSEAPLWRLLYVSQIAVHLAFRVAPAMKEILAQSHRLNARDGITGLLLSDGFWFVQVLEGPRAAVLACFERIGRDPRHADPCVRASEAISARSFARWSMCGLTLSPLDDALLRPPDIGFAPWTAPADALLQLLQGVAHRYADTLDAAHARLLDPAGGKLDGGSGRRTRRG